MVAATVLCPTCGTRRIGSFRFCLSCGLDYDAVVEPANSAASLQDAAPGSMGSRRRVTVEDESSNQASSMAGALGRDLNFARRRRELTQAQLGHRVGLSGARIGELERGNGATAPLEVWVRLGQAMDRPLVVGFSEEPGSRQPSEALRAARELLLNLAREHGWQTIVPVPTRPRDPARSVEVVLQDDADRALIVVEVWNWLDDLEAAVRSTDARLADASGSAAVAAGTGPPDRVAACWLLADRAANRRLVAGYQEFLESRFPGSSVRWVRCLGHGTPPPIEPGFAWIDPQGRRVVPFRRRRRS